MPIRYNSCFVLWLILQVAYPSIDWITYANKFVSSIGLEREQYTTQISHYDSIAAICDNVKRINTILINCARDFWMYISMDYFKQKIVSEEVGSSAMPHKGKLKLNERI